MATKDWHVMQTLSPERNDLLLDTNLEYFTNVLCNPRNRTMASLPDFNEERKTLFEKTPQTGPTIISHQWTRTITVNTRSYIQEVNVMVEGNSVKDVKLRVTTAGFLEITVDRTVEGAVTLRVGIVEV